MKYNYETIEDYFGKRLEDMKKQVKHNIVDMSEIDKMFNDYEIKTNKAKYSILYTLWLDALYSNFKEKTLNYDLLKDPDDDFRNKVKEVYNYEISVIKSQEVDFWMFWLYGCSLNPDNQEEYEPYVKEIYDILVSECEINPNIKIVSTDKE